MSIFGDLDTPISKQPEPPPRQLADLSLSVHQAEYDPPSDSVHLHAEATTAFSDGIAHPGIPVTFFLNGQRLPAAKTDEFGLALLTTIIAKESLRPNNELVARIAGFAKAATAKFAVIERSLAFAKPLHRWQRTIEVEVWKGWQSYNSSASVSSSAKRHSYYRCEGPLTIRVKAQCKDCSFSLQGIEVHVLGIDQDGTRRKLGGAILDSTGTADVHIEGYFSDSGRYGNAYKDRTEHPGGVDYWTLKNTQSTSGYPELNNLCATSLEVHAPKWGNTKATFSVAQQGELSPS